MPHCSFCGRQQSEEVRLLEANDVTICNHCVLFAYQAFEAEEALPTASSDPGFEDPSLSQTQTRARSYRPPPVDGSNE